MLILYIGIFCEILPRWTDEDIIIAAKRQGKITDMSYVVNTIAQFEGPTYLQYGVSNTACIRYSLKVAKFGMISADFAVGNSCTRTTRIPQILPNLHVMDGSE